LALDRQMIEKRDFPIGRRGYDIAAVDAHLATLAEEFEALKRGALRTSRQDPTLAHSAAEQVRTIVEAAEQSADEIEREAELEARRLRQDAREHAERVRSEAGAQAREHVDAVSVAARSMLERVETMQRELQELTESLRAGTSRVNADLSLLSANVEEVRAATADAQAATTPELPAAGDTLEALEGEPVPEPSPEPDPLEDPVEQVPTDVAEEEPVEADGAGAGADEEGARLIALNMALSGTPRDETERYLAENYELPDPQGLLDDVYARAGQ
jgi:cell division septum initiation protein DivIVA